MPNIISKILDDQTMQRILDMANAMASTALSKKDLIATSVISFIIGGVTYYLFVQRTKPKPNTNMSEMSEVPSSSITRTTRPAPLQPGIDPVTGLPEITPPDKIVHQAPDSYGSVAPGPHGMEIHVEVARQAARDAEEVSARRGGNQGRNESVLGSIKRVQGIGGGMGSGETAQGGVATAVQGTTGGMGGGVGSGGGGGYGLDDGDWESQTPSTQDARMEDGQEEGGNGSGSSEDSWDESTWGPRYPRSG